MLKQIQDRKIEELEFKLEASKKVIKELVKGLDTDSKEIRMLIRDVAIEFLNEDVEHLPYILDDWDAWQP